DDLQSRQRQGLPQERAVCIHWYLLLSLWNLPVYGSAGRWGGCRLPATETFLNQCISGEVPRSRDGVADDDAAQDRLDRLPDDDGQVAERAAALDRRQLLVPHLAPRRGRKVCDMLPGRVHACSPWLTLTFASQRVRSILNKTPTVAWSWTFSSLNS